MLLLLDLMLLGLVGSFVGNVSTGPAVAVGSTVASGGTIASNGDLSGGIYRCDIRISRRLSLFIHKQTK